MSNYQDIKAAIKAVSATGRATMLWGSYGIGKTAMHNELAAEAGEPIYLVSAEIMMPVDMHGVPVPDMITETTKWMKPGFLPFEGTDLAPGKVFIDEINRANKEMQSALYPLVLEKKIGNHVLKSGCSIHAAANRKEDKSGVNAMQVALASRFTHFHLEADLEQWIAGHALHQTGAGWPMLIQFLRLKERSREKMERLFNVPATSADSLCNPNPRAWSAVAPMIDFPDGCRFLSIKGTVGETAASELEAFLRVRMELASMADIQLDPMKAPLPQSPAARFAMAGMIAHCAERRNFQAVMSYAERLGSEFAAMVAIDVTTRDKSMKDHAAYVQWAIANQDVTL